jgi:hypothetical protein
MMAIDLLGDEAAVWAESEVGTPKPAANNSATERRNQGQERRLSTAAAAKGEAADADFRSWKSWSTGLWNFTVQLVF